MKRPAWLTREVMGWTAFDFANQAFTMVIITALYQQFFIKQVVPMVDGSDARGKRLWEASNITAELIIIAISPLLGALADFSGAKKKFLFVTYVGCVGATLLLGLAGPGAVSFAMLFYIVGYVFFAAGENFLNGFLPEVASQTDMGRVSAFSWAIAYTGALVSTAVSYVILALAGDGHLGFGLVCAWCGVYFLIGGAPTFAMLKERKLREQLPAGQSIATVGFHRMASTFREISRYQQLMRFLVISMIYLAGMQVVIFYAGTIARDLFGFSDAKQGIFFAQVIITGIIGAAIVGRVQDRIGTRTTIQALLVIWGLTLLVAGFATREWIFWIAANFVGFSMGALGSASRVMAGLFSPQHKAGEFFGFYGMANKMAVILGLGFQFVLGALGAEFNVAIGASAVFFVIGFFLMFTINERAGRMVAIKAAREHAAKHHDYAGEIADEAA
jgi:UMF1 family MFS transporter